MFIIGIFFSFLGLLSGLVAVNFSNAQSRGNDIVAKNDINSIYQKLEEHYNEYGEYPTQREVTEEYDQTLPGLDPEALIDEEGKIINEGTYSYEPQGCQATGCLTYTLSATLEDGSNYSKQSLN
jgi:type II secretory pathway pseudopilin PulG